MQSDTLKLILNTNPPSFQPLEKYNIFYFFAESTTYDSTKSLETIRWTACS